MTMRLCGLRRQVHAWLPHGLRRVARAAGRAGGGGNIFCRDQHDVPAGIDEIMHMCAYLSYGILIYNMMCLQGVHLFLDTLVHLQ